MSRKGFVAIKELEFCTELSTGYASSIMKTVNAEIARTQKGGNMKTTHAMHLLTELLNCKADKMDLIKLNYTADSLLARVQYKMDGIDYEIEIRPKLATEPEIEHLKALALAVARKDQIIKEVLG